MDVIYLDHNIFIELIQNKIQLDNLLKSTNSYVVYSPAHIEEIAVSFKNHNIPEKTINLDLNAISSITNNNIMFPNHGVDNSNIDYAAYIKKEHPFECYKRVISQYHVNSNAEKINKEVLLDAKDNSFNGNKPIEINNIHYKEILKVLLDEQHITIKETLIMSYNNFIKEVENSHLIKLGYINKFDFNFDDFKNNFFKISTVIELLANILESNGYHYEKTTDDKLLKKGRSRMHDVSHMIYGAFSKKFITGDKKLFKKTEAIYSYLKIDTIVLFYDQEKKILCDDI